MFPKQKWPTIYADRPGTPAPSWQGSTNVLWIPPPRFKKLFYVSKKQKRFHTYLRPLKKSEVSRVSPATTTATVGGPSDDVPSCTQSVEGGGNKVLGGGTWRPGGGSFLPNTLVCINSTFMAPLGPSRLGFYARNKDAPSGTVWLQKTKTTKIIFHFNEGSYGLQRWRPRRPTKTEQNVKDQMQNHWSDGSD